MFAPSQAVKRQNVAGADTRKGDRFSPDNGPDPFGEKGTEPGADRNGASAPNPLRRPVQAGCRSKGPVRATHAGWLLGTLCSNSCERPERQGSVQ